MTRQRETIFALSSGSLPCAIAIVRISGPDARSVAPLLGFGLPQPRRAVARTIGDGSGGVLDHGLVLFFAAPHSATGEDVLELHVHGSRAVVRALLQCLAAAPGLRPAEAGEFTRRALESGRIDVLHAEALGDLLAAETEVQRRRAIDAPTNLSASVERYRREILSLSSALEAAIDHGEELSEEGLESIRERLGALGAEIGDALRQPSASRLRDGFRVVLAGPPNAGKSTLLNVLAGREAAITSPTEGTTRDLIDVAVSLGDMPVRLIDTAGLRETGDAVEAIGIERAEQAIAGADVLIWLGNDAPPTGTGAVIPILARADLIQPTEMTGRLRVSAQSGEGIAALRHAIRQTLAEHIQPPGEAMWNDRQRDLLAAMADQLEAARDEADLVLMAEEVGAARLALDRIVGRAGLEELLDSVFSAFCVGK